MLIASALSPATGPLAAAALLLAVAGWAKLRRPAATGLALARVGLPGSDTTVRALGAVEIVAAAAALAIGAAAAVAVGLLYCAFAAFTLVQLRRARAGDDVVADCGCFGDSSAPVGVEHVVMNVGLAAAAGWGATSGGVLAGLEAEPLATLAVVAMAVVAAMGLRAILTDWAEVRSLMASPEAAGA